MKRTHSSSVGDRSVVRRLWTGEDEARSLLTEPGQDLDGVMLQQARVADSVTKQGGKDSRVRRFRISTETQDRHGDIVRTKGILLKHFRKNPVVLFAHDAWMPPIGKCPRIKLGNGVVDADVDFFTEETYEFAETIFKIVEVGGLKATSIGFMPLKHERMGEDDDDNISGSPWAIDFKRIDLLEFSIVPVPANPEAVRSIAKSGALMDPYKKWLDDMQDNWKHVEPLLLDLGIVEADVTAVRKAVDGNGVSVQMPDNWGDDLSEELLTELDILDVGDEDGNEFDPQPLMVHEDTYDTDSGEKIQIVQLQGEFPKHTSFSTELIEAADTKYVSREEDSITISLENASAKYEIVGESEDGNVIEATLVECDYKAVNTFDTAHPDNTLSQAPDAAWNGAREEREASVESLGVMSAWRSPTPDDDEATKDDFKFLHHCSSPPHAVNLRALAVGMAALNGARDGADIPDEDRRGVWNHLARHIRENFNDDPPELRWIEVEPLKEFTDLFYFDYVSSKLLVRSKVGEEVATFIDARGVTVSEDGELSFPDNPKKQWIVRTLSSRQRKWTSLELFKTWAMDEGFDTESLSETRHFWRLAQDKGPVTDSMVISLYPNDVEPASADCVVQATLIPKQAEVPDEVSKVKPQSMPATFALAADGAVEIGVPLEDLDESDSDEQGWALLIISLDNTPSQVLVLDVDSAQDADVAVRGMAKAFGPKSLFLGRLVGTRDKGVVSVYTDYALYRFKNGTVLRTALDAEAVDELQDFLDGLERLKVVVEDLSDDERQQLMVAKDWLDEVLVEEVDDDDPDEGDDFEALLVQSLSDEGGELPKEICDAVKDVMLDLAPTLIKDIAAAATRKEVGLVD